MKKIHLTLLFIICFLTPSLLHAQCFPLVPGNAQVIPFGANDSNFFHPGLTHHICGNASYYYYGNNPDTIYLDGSAILRIGFCQNLTVYMRNNSQLHIDTTTSGLYLIKKIVYDTTFTWFVDTAHATIDSLIACPGMNYNYGSFPGSNSPCYMSVVGESEAVDIKIYPTVTSGEVRIETSLPDYEIRVQDMIGKQIVLSENKDLISIVGASPGMYVVTIRKHDRIIYTQKIFLVK